MAETDWTGVNGQFAEGPARGSQWWRRKPRFLSIFAALIIALGSLSQGAAAQGSGPVGTQVEAAAGATGVDSAGAQPSPLPLPGASPGQAEVSPAGPAATSNAPAPDPLSQLTGAAAADPFDAEAAPATDWTSLGAAAEVPPAAPVPGNEDAAVPSVALPGATGEAGSHAVPAEATAAASVALPDAGAPVVSPADAARTHPRTSTHPPSSKPSRDRSPSVAVVLRRTLPHFSAGVAAASGPVPPSPALLRAAARPRPARGAAAVVDEERAPPAPVEDPDPPGTAGTPEGALGSGANASGSGSPPSVLIMFTVLACVGTLLFERLVVTSAPWRSEGFTSLRERPG